MWYRKLTRRAQKRQRLAENHYIDTRGVEQQIASIIAQLAPRGASKPPGSEVVRRISGAAEEALRSSGLFGGDPPHLVFWCPPGRYGEFSPEDNTIWLNPGYLLADRLAYLPMPLSGALKHEITHAIQTDRRGGYLRVPGASPATNANGAGEAVPAGALRNDRQRYLNNHVELQAWAQNILDEVDPEVGVDTPSSGGELPRWLRERSETFRDVDRHLDPYWRAFLLRLLTMRLAKTAIERPLAGGASRDFPSSEAATKRLP